MKATLPPSRKRLLTTLKQMFVLNNTRPLEKKKKQVERE